MPAGEYGSLYVASEWIIRVVMLLYIPQRRSAAAARTWLLLVFLLPWAGLALYALFGRIYMPKKRIEMQARASALIREVQGQMPPQSVWQGYGLPDYLRPLPDWAASLGDFRAFPGNRVELLTDYRGTLERLIADIEVARHHVHLLFYIIEDDDSGRAVGAALERAVQRGVACRVLMDAVGSSTALKRLAPGWRAAGIEVRATLPVGVFRRNAARFDLRNHRKLAVIDGSIGYTGSQNLVNPEFVPDLPNVELTARIEGSVVSQLQAVFLGDRYFETGDTLQDDNYFPIELPPGDTPLQLVPSGPGYQRENAEECLLGMIYAAREEIVIATPYFVPDDAFLQALRLAARRGVDVRLIATQRSNSRLTHLAQQSFYEELLEAGVKIYLYRSGHLHAKHLSFDRRIGVVGSTNIDIRSFELNAEVMLLIYDATVTGCLRDIQAAYEADAEPVLLSAWSQRPAWLRIAQNVAKLADKLL